MKKKLTELLYVHVVLYFVRTPHTTEKWKYRTEQ